MDDHSAVIPFRRWAARASRALRRRTRFAWAQTVVHAHASCIERAVGPLCGIADDADTAATADALAVAWKYGQVDFARRLVESLVTRQLEDGSFPGRPGTNASPYATARILSAFGGRQSRDPELATPARHAADYLFRGIDQRGQIEFTRLPGTAIERWGPAALRLACVAPLYAAASRWGEARWAEAVRRVLGFHSRHYDLACWNTTLELFAAGLDALLDLGLSELVVHAVQLPLAVQRDDGAVPAEWNGIRVSPEGVARLASVWYRLGMREPADRAMAWLERVQLDDGGFTTTVTPTSPRGNGRKSTAAVVQFLKATHTRVATSFVPEAACFAEPLSDEDGRLLAVQRWMHGFPPGARIAEAGCGPGRFLNRLHKQLPHLRLTGIDLAAGVLEALPPGVEPVPASLLDLPFDDGTFDGVFAVESLEHTLLPQRAVAELGRVVRPGGALLIVDKHRKWQPLCDHEPWERWFEPAEVSRWLAQSCGEITVQPVSCGPGERHRDLFLCWTARCQTPSQRAA